VAGAAPEEHVPLVERRAAVLQLADMISEQAHAGTLAVGRRCEDTDHNPKRSAMISLMS
jgi:hypothetical protein